MAQFACRAVVHFSMKCDNDMAFHVRSYQLTGELIEWFDTRNNPYSNEHYVISHGREEQGGYYYKVLFANKLQAILFKLATVI